MLRFIIVATRSQSFRSPSKPCSLTTMWTIKRENLEKGTKRKSRFIGHLVTWDLRERNSIWVKWYPDPAPFETLISQLMSTNDQQSQVKSLFHLYRNLQPDALISKLATTLHSSHHEIRAMSAFLLCKLLTRDSSLSPNGDSSSSSYLWPRLLPASQASHEEVKSIAKKLCDTVSELAAGLLPDDTWPELLPSCSSLSPPTIPTFKNQRSSSSLSWLNTSVIPYSPTFLPFTPFSNRFHLVTHRNIRGNAFTMAMLLKALPS